MSAPTDRLEVRPASAATFADLQTVFGTRGQGANCQCQRFRLPPGESFAAVPVEVRRERLRGQTSCEDPTAATTSGLVAYLDGEPVGWCAVAPRTQAPRLRNSPVPWQGRDEDPDDADTWALTCVFARAGFRRQGIGGELVRAAVGFARDRGARALEAYPMTTGAAVSEELGVGILPMFLDAGLAEVSRPTGRRAVVRTDFS